MAASPTADLHLVSSSQALRSSRTPFTFKVRHACAQEDRCAHVPLCILAFALLLSFLHAENDPLSPLQERHHCLLLGSQ
jgi:hypothetical protein